MWQISYDDSPTLYLVPTPIGNLDDMTYRSINILNTVEVIFSEDTRVTLQLLNHFDIKKKLIALHDHNEDSEKEKVLEYLKNGKSVAIVTDRGTPIISDPGYKTVKYVTDNGYNVVGLPGANAFVPALITSSIEPSPFMFYGFLNSKDSKRKAELESLKFCKYTIIFYEAPHRIKKTMEEILEIFGDRQVSLSREISKKFESIYRGNISDLLSTLNNIKGEFVIVVSPYKEDNSNNNELSIIDNVKLYIENGMEVMDAIKRVAKERNIPKNEIYREYHRRNL
ncbi:MAG: 16S rRNA (cytidine(1402)-2'-O)-methyltransferase [Bacilli bacterium]|nr:16S rRNA (cytidine(1402)-2'-O)-methyltransferase [Bacilli bacterium]